MRVRRWGVKMTKTHDPIVLGDACVVCLSAEHLSACRGCGRIICPSHRYGTGSLSDGYSCKRGECLIFTVTGVRPLLVAPAAPVQRKSIPKVLWESKWIVLAILVFGAATVADVVRLFR